MKKLIWIPLLVLLLAACSALGGPAALKPDEFDAAAKIVNPMADNILASLKSGDYAAFSRDMNNQMKSAIGQAQFDSMRQMFDTKIGAFTARQAMTIVNYQGYYVATLTLTYEKAPSVSMQLSVSTSEPHQVGGLYFTSPELQAK